MPGDDFVQISPHFVTVLEVEKKYDLSCKFIENCRMVAQVACPSGPIELSNQCEREGFNHVVIQCREALNFFEVIHADRQVF